LAGAPSVGGLPVKEMDVGSTKSPGAILNGRRPARRAEHRDVRSNPTLPANTGCVGQCSEPGGL